MWIDAFLNVWLTLPLKTDLAVCSVRESPISARNPTGSLRSLSLMQLPQHSTGFPQPLLLESIVSTQVSLAENQI